MKFIKFLLLLVLLSLSFFIGTKYETFIKTVKQQKNSHIEVQKKEKDQIDNNKPITQEIILDENILNDDKLDIINKNEGSSEIIIEKNIENNDDEFSMPSMINFDEKEQQDTNSTQPDLKK